MRLALCGFLVGEGLLIGGVAVVFWPAALMVAGAQLVYLSLTRNTEPRVLTR